LFVLIISLVSSVCVSADESEINTLVNENFENYSIGSFSPSDDSVETFIVGENTREIAETEKGKSLYLAANVNTFVEVTYKTGEVREISAKASFKFTEKLKNIILLSFKDSRGIELATVRIDNDGYFAYGINRLSEEAIVPGQWYDVEMQASVFKKKATVLINDEIVINDVYFHKAGKEIVSVTTSTRVLNDTAYYIDDIVIKGGAGAEASVDINNETIEGKTYIVNENFDSGAVDDDNIIFAGADTSEFIKDGDNTYLYLASPGGKTAMLSKKLSDVPENFSAEVYFMLPDGINAKWSKLLAFSDAIGREAISVVIGSDGSLKLGSVVGYGALKKGIWYNVKLEVNTVNSTSNLYINGDRVLTGIPFVNKVKSLNKFFVKAYTPVSGGFYLDGLNIYY
jgi:hypothetical protein